VAAMNEKLLLHALPNCLTFPLSLRRFNIIKELIVTEEDYISDMNLLVEVFIAPLRQQKITTDAELTTIFSNVEMLRGVNEQLLADLVKDLTNLIAINIGQVLSSLCAYLLMYKSYCATQQSALAMVEQLKNKNAAFAQFLDVCWSRCVLVCLAVNLRNYAVLYDSANGHICVCVCACVYMCVHVYVSEKVSEKSEREI